MITEKFIWIGLILVALCFVYAAVRYLRAKKVPKEVAEPKSHPQVPKSPVQMEKNLARALTSTRKGWVTQFSEALLGKSTSADPLFEQIEEILYSADIGIKTSGKLLDLVKSRLKVLSEDDRSKVRSEVSDEILAILKKVERPAIIKNGAGPCVVMFVGVNGVGKTTTIGKLAAQLTAQGYAVVLGAGDTFRAAATQQLEIWANRSGAKIVCGVEGADPSSVLFDAVTKAKEENADFVLCDTAGRLHTKVNLMDELKKVHRVLQKACEGAPHEVLLVVDATTGQNAIEQARQFQAATTLSGVVLTKLDGTAKGGVVIGIADELGIPIRYVGVGESTLDLRPFIAEEFVEALFANDEKGDSDGK